MRKLIILVGCLLLTSCFTEPKKEQTVKSNLDNTVFENKSEVITDSLPAPKTSSQSGEDFAKSMFIKTFDSKCEIYNHYDGCGCYFASSKEDFYAGDKNVFYGTLLGEEGADIELLINDKIEKLIFVKKEKVGLKVYYKYANSEHEAIIELKKEDIETEEGLYLSGNIVVDKKYISELFGRCGC